MRRLAILLPSKNFAVAPSRPGRRLSRSLTEKDARLKRSVLFVMTTIVQEGRNDLSSLLFLWVSKKGMVNGEASSLKNEAENILLVFDVSNSLRQEKLYSQKEPCRKENEQKKRPYKQVVLLTVFC